MSNNILKNIDTLVVHASRSLRAELSRDDIPLEARIERADTWWRVLQIARFLKDDANFKSANCSDLLGARSGRSRPGTGGKETRL